MPLVIVGVISTVSLHSIKLFHLLFVIDLNSLINRLPRSVATTFITVFKFMYMLCRNFFTDQNGRTVTASNSHNFFLVANNMILHKCPTIHRIIVVELDFDVVRFVFSISYFGIGDLLHDEIRVFFFFPICGGFKIIQCVQNFGVQSLDSSAQILWWTENHSENNQKSHIFERAVLQPFQHIFSVIVSTPQINVRDFHEI